MERQQVTTVVSIAAVTVLAIAGTYWLSSYYTKRRVDAVLARYRKALQIPVSALVAMRDDFISQTVAALSGKKSSMMMLPSMVDVLPNGYEQGEYYALDIGGTNFRCLYVKLSEQRGVVEKTEIQDYPIPEHYFTVPMTKVFDLLAQEFIDFRQKRPALLKTKQKPVIGLCFSLPCSQTGLAEGKIIQLNKRFENPGAVGMDPVKELKAALDRAGLNCEVNVLLNDSIGTFAGGRYLDPDIMIGIILGTGTNMAYLERKAMIHNVPKKLPPGYSDEMLINSEWGCYDSPLLPRLDEDHKVDWASGKPGQMLFEKMVSGLFMGEVARLVIIALIKEGGLFGARTPPALEAEWTLKTPMMAAMHEDTTTMRSKVASQLEKLGLPSWNVSYWERLQVQEVCGLVCNRSAQLSAMALAAVLRHLGRDGSQSPPERTCVVMDGGIAEHYAGHRNLMGRALADLLGEAAASKVVLTTVRESSSMGAAFLAAAAKNAQGKQHRE